jgi:hypothetical protein
LLTEVSVKHSLHYVKPALAHPRVSARCRNSLDSGPPGRSPRALADRLLALPPELRRLGVSQISQVAMLDAGQAARLSPLFD